ncbi:MAG: PQQ-dependent sugar dehydrogenase [bacterium]|nr:PQQ-dependent sugar dehydrogenase [bacterium]
MTRPALPLLALCLASSAPAQNVKATQIEIIPQRPISMSVAPGDTSRIYIGNKRGVVYLLVNEVRQSTPFLDIAAMVDDAGEGGFLGVAMHPDYVNNGQFYVSYNTFPTGDHVLSMFTRSAGNPNVADPSSEQILFGPYPHTTPGHKAGDIHFGPDGLLYLALGDGLAGGMGVGERAQDLMDARGKLLRFDVDLPFPHTPPTNPYVGNPNALDEIYALGLRNPFRFGIDSLTGDIYLGDVGQSGYEEIDFIPAGTAPVNFGWKCKEGPVCFGTPPPSCVCSNPAFVDPLHSYVNGVDGCAVIGGKVYRGSQIPSLYGWYLFGDFCANRFWALQHDGTNVTAFQDLTPQLSPSFQITGGVAFGEDANGELYILSHYSGQVWKIEPDCITTPYCSANTNSTGSEATISISGSQSLAANALTLEADDLPNGQFGYFLMADDQDFLPLFGGSQGNLCLGTPIVRFAGDVQNSGATGSVSFQPDFGNLPNGTTLEVGDSWNFQYWYRDQNPGITSNTTAGVEVQLCP